MKKHFFKWFVIILVLTAFSACKKEAKTSIDTAGSVQSLHKAWKAFALPNELLPLDLWGRVDSNHRTDTRTDLQSVAIATMRLPQR